MDGVSAAFLTLMLLAAASYLVHVRINILVDRRMKAMYAETVSKEIQDFYKEMDSYTVLLDNRISRFRKLQESQKELLSRWEQIAGMVSSGKRGKELDRIITASIAREQEMIRLMKEALESRPAASDFRGAIPAAKLENPAPGPRVALENYRVTIEKQDAGGLVPLQDRPAGRSRRSKTSVPELPADSRVQKARAESAKPASAPAAKAGRPDPGSQSGNKQQKKTDVRAARPARENPGEIQGEDDFALDIARGSNAVLWGEATGWNPAMPAPEPVAESRPAPPENKQPARHDSLRDWLSRIGRAVEPLLQSTPTTQKAQNSATGDADDFARRLNAASGPVSAQPAAYVSPAYEELDSFVPAWPAAPSPGEKKLELDDFSEFIDRLKVPSTRPDALRTLRKLNIPMEALSDFSQIPLSDLEATRSIYKIE